MNAKLDGKRVAILVADGFEQVEMTKPRRALEEAGAETDLVAPATDEVKGWNFTEWGNTFPVDVPLDQADPEEYDALFLPGGVLNPDKLRRNPQVHAFVRAFFDYGKPVGAICHGAQTLIDIGLVRGRKMTSYESIQTDLKNAGAQWTNEPVVVDQGLVTSRKPDDIPAFVDKFMEEILEGVHAGQAEAAHGQTESAKRAA